MAQHCPSRLFVVGGGSQHSVRQKTDLDLALAATATTRTCYHVLFYSGCDGLLLLVSTL